MFTPDQDNSAALPQDNIPDAPTTIEDVSSLIHKVLCAAPNHTLVEDNLTDASAAEAETDPPQTLSKIYAALPSPNIKSMQDQYESITYMYVSYDVTNLYTFA